MKQPPSEAQKLLDAARVKISTQYGDRTDNYSGAAAPLSRVRVSVSLFNNSADIQRMLEASDRLRA